MRVKVSKRHQVALPSRARQHLGIAAGDRLLVDVQDNLLILLPEPADYTARLAGLHAGLWAGAGTPVRGESAGAAYLAQERAAWHDPAPTDPNPPDPA